MREEDVGIYEAAETRSRKKMYGLWLSDCVLTLWNGLIALTNSGTDGLEFRKRLTYITNT